MSTISSALSSLLSPTTSSNASGGSNASSGSNASGGGYGLTPADFINLMVTQLKNQDPLSPASDSELLSQMSEIGQLQSSTDLQTTMKSVTLQTQVGSASALIGKSITGINTANKSVSGTVDSVGVSGSTVNLKLDTGDTVAISNVSSIAATSTAGSTTTSGSTTTN